MNSSQTESSRCPRFACIAWITRQYHTMCRKCEARRKRREINEIQREMRQCYDML